MFADGTHDMTRTRPGIARRPGQVHFRIQCASVQFTALKVAVDEFITRIRFPQCRSACRLLGRNERGAEVENSHK